MYEIGTITYIQCPIYKLEKGGHDIFQRGGGGMGTMGHVTHYYFKRGGAFSEQQIKHLRVIHITSYSILNVHQVFMLIEISKIHIGGYAIIKTGRRKNGLTFSVCK